MSSEVAFAGSTISQSVTGDRNIFAATGDVNVVYNLPQVDAEDLRKLLILLDRVRQFWVEGVLERSVQNEALIDLGKETQPGAVERPWEQILELPNGNQRLPPETRIVDIFETVGRLLLILGEPGSGKTVTLLELARDIAARAKIDPGQPVPVVFNLSSWNERYKSLSDWLAEELRTKYFIPKQIGCSWLNRNRLLLLIDGLDEVQHKMRVACIRAINAFLQDTGTSGIVVCSRLSEYVSTPTRLKMNGAICLQPLTLEQVAAYVSSFGSQLDGLRAALSSDAVLGELAKSPLMLSVMTLAYQGASTGALSADEERTAESWRAQIFATYIQRMFERKGRQGSIYAKHKAIIWLSWLADKMLKNSQTVFAIESLQPTWLSTARQIAYYYLFSRLVGSTIAWAAAFGVSTLYLFLLYQDFLRDMMITIFFMSSRMIYLNIFALLLTCACSFLIDFTRFHFGRCLDNSSLVRKTIDSPVLIFSAYLIGSMSAAVTANYLSVIFAEDPLGGVFPFSFFASIPSMLVAGGLPGTLLGLAYCRRTSTTDVRFLDHIRWSWKQFATFWAVVCVLTIFAYAAGVSDLNALEYALTYTIVMLIPLSPFSVLLGLKTDVIQGAARWMGFSWIQALYPGLCMYAISIIVYVLMRQIDDPNVVTVSNIYILFALMPTLGVVLSYGAIDIANHRILRLILYRSGVMPPAYEKFLDHCTNLVVLRKVGYGYIFIHRVLLEHFAGMWKNGIKDKGCSIYVPLTRGPAAS